MRLLTLNTHSLEQEQMDEKQKIFADAIPGLDPDVMGLQEVNQTMSAKPVEVPEGFHILNDQVILREDNHALKVFELLNKEKLVYECWWLPIKIGYSKYDEGLAIFSKKPALKAWSIQLSPIDDYSDYHTRKALAIQTEDGIFASVHMGWWKDGFKDQWAMLKQAFDPEAQVYLMGDFNADASIRNEGYDLMISDGWFDLFENAKQKDDGFTVVESIDGWKDQSHSDQMRLDYILSSKPVQVDLMRTIFSGKQEPVISDHFGLFAILTPLNA